MSRWRTAEQRADANRAALDTWYRNGTEPPEPEIKDMSTSAWADCNDACVSCGLPSDYELCGRCDKDWNRA